MAYFPLFIELSGTAALLIGGGKTALGKARRLGNYGLTLHAIAPDILPELEALPYVETTHRSFLPGDLDAEYVFVIAATDSRDVNHLVSQLCREKKIPVNVVDTPEDCSFLFPALVQQGPLCIGISTGGASPTGARRLKDTVSRILPSNIGDILSWLEAVRPGIKARIPSESQRKTVFDLLYSRCVSLNRPLTEPELEELLEEAAGPADRLYEHR